MVEMDLQDHNISPYYDSLLVKTISWDRNFNGAINKTIRSIKRVKS